MNNVNELKDKSKEMKIANIYMEKELIERLDKLAALEYRKRSDLVRMIIKKYIEEKEGVNND